jgi:hypothetical protein
MSEDAIRALLDVGRSLHSQLEQVIDDHLRQYGYDVTAMVLSQQSQRLARIYACELTEPPRDPDSRCPLVVDYLSAPAAGPSRRDREMDGAVE